MTFGTNCTRDTHSSTYSKWSLISALRISRARFKEMRSIATAWHVRDVISRFAPGIRIVLAITEGSEVEFWILARPFGTRVTRRDGRPEGEDEGASRDDKSPRRGPGRCEKRGYVAYLRNSGRAARL